MNSGRTSERAYDDVKRRILAGEFRPGDPLDPIALARGLESSQTPVREALHILTGQGLVVTGANEGFHMPHLDAADLQDLYAWNAQVLILAVRDWGDTPQPSAQTLHQSIAVPGSKSAALFDAIARRSTNVEHARTVEAINDRLHAARRAESVVLVQHEEELAPLLSSFESESRTQLTRLIGTYHRRRQRVAANVVRTLYRAL